MIVYLGNPTLTPDQEARLQVILDATCQIVKNWIGDQEFGQKTYRLRYSDIDYGCCNMEIALPTHQVVSIDEINGQTYTGLQGLSGDYVVTGPKNRVVVIRDFWDYTNRSEFCIADITYTAGYNPLPDDLLYLQKLLAEGERYKSEGKPVKSYKLRQRTVSFGDLGDSGATPRDNLSSVKSILSKYTTLDTFIV